MGCINDAFNRPINYLRVSVTDRCNFRCLYCLPPEGVQLLPHDEVLRYEEITLIVRAAAQLGLSKVRLTGGEPLVRAGIEGLVRELSGIPGIDDLALTTNGALLGAKSSALAAAGLRRVNVSLDTLRPERFYRVTRGGELSRTLAGIEAARHAGLSPLKLNVVVVRGLNDDEVQDFARLTVERDWHVRFIELMPLGESTEWAADGYVPTQEIRATVAELGTLTPATGNSLGWGNGPARYYRLPGARGTVGFISPVSEHFCFQCNRLRLTADGKLRPCLLRADEVDLRAALRSGADVEEVGRLIAQAVNLKPEGHGLARRLTPSGRGMSQIGG